MMPGWLKRGLLALEGAGYTLTAKAAWPVNAAIARMLARRVTPGSVLHVSGMVHVAYHTVRILRDHGVHADYLAVGTSPWWDQADYVYRATRVPVLSVLKEIWWVWTVVSRYEIVHSHFMAGVSRSGWEWPLLKRMGRTIVVHYRGCEIRDRELNRRLHPDMNICEECDYAPPICVKHAERRRVMADAGSAFLVTTPDLKDFAPKAVHVPFFVTRQQATAAARPAGKRPFKIVHATNHPGIEGTRHIQRAIDALKAKGHAIDFVPLHGVTHDRVIAELADADLTVGKMKMGYYANFQVESLAAGVPAVTYVRDELVTDAIRNSGLILATLDTLQATIEKMITDPAALEGKRRVARASVASLHDNDTIAAQLASIYDEARRKAAS
jgi:glycosyltransferase involved in cell wall biosynthesis